MDWLNFFKEINANYGTLIQAVLLASGFFFVAVGFLFAGIQLRKIKTTTRSIVMNEIVSSSRELNILRLQHFSFLETEKGRNIFSALITNHFANVFEQRKLLVISDNLWEPIKYDMQQAFLDNSLRKWWKHSEIQRCYSVGFREFINRRILPKT